MSLAELLVLAAVVFGAAWLLWDRERRLAETVARHPSSVRVIPPEGWKK